MIWKHRRGVLDLTRQGAIMGILNVTPDSFSDGDPNRTVEESVSHALRMETEGASIIDVGGESTRPGARPVSADEELSRTIPVIRALRNRSGVLISIDTSKSVVAREAVDAGADIINDVTALQGDPDMPGLARDSRTGVVLMHMQGTPLTMQNGPAYEDVTPEVFEFLRHRRDWAVAFGVDVARIALDPGIGFGKLPEHNAALLRELGLLAGEGLPVMVGVSRKSFLRSSAGSAEIADRLWPGVALTSLCRELGARLFRVHEVLPHAQALRMTEAILGND